MKVLAWVLALSLILGIQGRPDKLQDSDEEESRRPYSFKYTASRYHHGIPDREHEEVRGADGITRGVYRYIDPRQRVQEVIYTVNEGGFNVKNSAVPKKPQDTNAVQTARSNHEQLFAKIQEEHSRIQAEQEANEYTEENQEIYEEVPFDYSVLPHHTEAVAQRAAYHQYLFEKTQAEHARIAAERGPYDPLKEEEYADAPFDYSVLPKHTSAVSARTALHQKLFEQTQVEHARIAAERGTIENEEEQQFVAVPFNYSALPRQTEAVLARTAHHQTLFERIAAEHARIAAERAQLLPTEEEHQQSYQQI